MAATACSSAGELAVERDLSFRADKRLGASAREAQLWEDMTGHQGLSKRGR